MNELFICAHCGESHPISEQCLVGESEICPACADEETVVCSRCGERIWRYNNAGDEFTPMCHSCYDHHYTSCSSCGCIIRVEDACYAESDEEEESPFCRECYSSYKEEKVIHDYYYKPEPLFRGDGSRYFGVELEVDGAGENDDSAFQVIRAANRNVQEHIYIKHDGSLNDGFEIVTHPMTLEYHCKEMPWKAVLSKVKSLGYLSHQAGTCGLHIHVSRAAFGHSEAEQDAVIARILYFFEKNWEELLKFSRRTPRQLEHWAARYGYKEHPKEILDHAKKGYHGGRYSCVNLQNTDTIEFRIFRGTLKLNTLIATLQLVDRVCDVALFLSDEELKALSWTTFVSGIPDTMYPELVQYLKERRLYVNEAVVGEEEI
nr:amidoligase family protein [uncultured Oscillibacter sp.]